MSASAVACTCAGPIGPGAVTVAMVESAAFTVTVTIVESLLTQPVAPSTGAGLPAASTHETCAIALPPLGNVDDMFSPLILIPLLNVSVHIPFTSATGST